MQFVSWNCRGMGSKTKEEAIKDLVRMNSLEILLIQETKMEEPETIQASKKFWKKEKEEQSAPGEPQEG